MEKIFCLIQPMGTVYTLTLTVCSTGSLELFIVYTLYYCISLQGEQLGVPERVPFRLTHNMVHAMVRQILSQAASILHILRE